MANGKDIIVIGGSAGAMAAIQEILRSLTTDLPATLFIALHTAENSPKLLADIFSKSTPLPVRYPHDREPIELGTVYGAVPDRLLFVKPGEIRLVRGPKENNFRPAVDPLFRSAAQAYGERVIGVVLSGGLDDGTHGILQIKRRGGTAIAQSPDDAAEPSMPRSAIERVGVDYILPAAEIGLMLNKLVAPDSESPAPVGVDVPDLAEGLPSGLRLGSAVVPSSPFICPHCNGALWEHREGNLLRYRCHMGHGFTADTLSLLQSDSVEQALWVAIRSLEEQAQLQLRLADQTSHNAGFSMRERFIAKAADCQHTADLLRSLVVGGDREGLNHATMESLEDEYKTGS